MATVPIAASVPDRYYFILDFVYTPVTSSLPRLLIPGGRGYVNRYLFMKQLSMLYNASH